MAEYINNSDYDVLISTSTASSLEDKAASYKRAIEIYPERTSAYLYLLQAYEDEGRFSKSENDEFLALYNAHKDSFDESGTDVAELKYKIGMMYFNYYTEDDGRYSFSTRVQKAYSFFVENYESGTEFEGKALSDCYYHICSFYKRYILSASTVEEASKDNFEILFETIENALSSVEEAGAYDQLSLYNGTFMLLYDQRNNIVQVNVEQEEVLALLKKVYDRAAALTVQKEQSQKLRQEILDNYDEYREAIERAYRNAQERI